MKNTFLTKNGKKMIEDELKALKGPEMRRVLQSLADARDKGDLSENAEYEAAKAEHELLNIKIIKLEETLSNSTVIQKPADISKVAILTTVTVKDNKGQQRDFTIVPENEIDLKSGKISMNSPIGKGLMGKQVGEKAKIIVPNGTLEFDIIEIK